VPSTLSGAFDARKSSLNQHQFPAETHYSSTSAPTKVGRATKVIAVVSALTSGEDIQGAQSKWLLSSD